METKYTAKILFNGQQLDMQSGDNLNQLAAHVINHIETMFPNAQGEIRDNTEQKVIQRYRKVAYD